MNILLNGTANSSWHGLLKRVLPQIEFLRGETLQDALGWMTLGAVEIEDHRKQADLILHVFTPCMDFASEIAQVNKDFEEYPDKVFLVVLAEDGEERFSKDMEADLYKFLNHLRDSTRSFALFAGYYDRLKDAVDDIAARIRDLEQSKSGIASDFDFKMLGIKNGTEVLEEGGSDTEELSKSEVLYKFVGWLTSREERIILSSTDDAAPVTELVKEFCEANDLDGKLSPSEALYGFMAWLTGRPDVLTIGASEDCSPIPALIEQFCKTNNLADPSERYYTKLDLSSTDDNATAGGGVA